MSETITSSLLTMEQAAQRLGISARYVRWLVAHDAIPVVRLGRLVRLRSADIEQYILDHRREPAPVDR